MLKNKFTSDPLYAECPQCREPTTNSHGLLPAHTDVLITCTATDCDYSVAIPVDMYNMHMSQKKNL